MRENREFKFRDQGTRDAEQGRAPLLQGMRAEGPIRETSRRRALAWATRAADQLRLRRRPQSRSRQRREG